MSRKKARAKAKPGVEVYAPKTEMAALEELKPHPRNYRHHPEEQIRHIAASIRQHGFYRNIVVTRCGTILAGHGVVLASRSLGLTTVPVIRVDVGPEDPRALKILTSDNELGRFAEDDDRLLTELLKEIREEDPEQLLGTGYDESQLAALLMVTRPASEIANFNAAAEWVGMPEYHEDDGEKFQLVMTFDSEEERAEFVRARGIDIIKKQRLTWSARWPNTTREDAHSLRFMEEEKADREVDPEAPAITTRRRLRRSKEVSP